MTGSFNRFTAAPSRKDQSIHAISMAETTVPQLKASVGASKRTCKNQSDQVCTNFVVWRCRYQLQILFGYLHFIFISSNESRCFTVKHSKIVHEVFHGWNWESLGTYISYILTRRYCTHRKLLPLHSLLHPQNTCWKMSNTTTASTRKDITVCRIVNEKFDWNLSFQHISQTST